MKRHIALLSWTVAVVLALGALATPAGAQQPARMPRVGVLGTSSDNALTLAFQQGLRDLGYIENENISVEYRFYEGRADRLPGLAAELVDLDPDVIVALGAVPAQPLRQATTTIPIVFAINPDAAAVGLVPDNARPGGNLTGFSSFDADQARNQLELLNEMIPGLTRVAILWDRATAAVGTGDSEGQGELLGPAAKQNDTQARLLGLEPQLIALEGSNLDLEGAVQAAERGHAEAVVVLQQPITGLNRPAITELAIRYRLPALTWVDGVDDQWQGLVAYGTSLADAAYSTASYVDRILHGAQPGDLPVESVTRQTLIVNLETARKIGVTIPSEVIERADQVIPAKE